MDNNQNSEMNNNYVPTNNTFTNNNSNQKKGNGLVIVLVLIILIACAVGLYFFLFKDKNTTNNTNNNDNNTNTNTNIVKTTDFTGVYEKDGITIKLYAKDDKNVNYAIEGDNNYIGGVATLSSNSIEGKIFNKYTFTLNNKNIELKTDDDKVPSVTYIRQSDYTINDFYKDVYGDAIYLNSKYNGDYTTGNTKIYMYQKNEEEVRIYISKSLSVSDLLYEIKDDGSLYCEQFGNEYTVTFNDNQKQKMNQLMILMVHILKLKH